MYPTSTGGELNGATKLIPAIPSSWSFNVCAWFPSKIHEFLSLAETWRPTPTLSVLVVVPDNAKSPIAMFPSPVVCACRAALPIATLLSPDLLLFNAPFPTATLFEPVMPFNIALNPSAAFLLPVVL